ncbi:uncharacterized protein LOC106152494 [Lingula anatina]|uniref:Uncharacterized protein LOC106152494 n=1 Tax=Lingula anatina TaxID=7574 RepID=A0A1S3H7U5_LINAN|nr:uncharacterized protein LOC106152494 [Lingula anatina]|eukprot:XP_013381556.1 uncharacterized protein LOC106152494 [Lingula anatina]
MLASRGLSACCSKVMPMGSFSKSLRAFGPGHILKSSGTGRGVQITRKATGFHKISSFSGRLYPRKLNTARCSTAYCTYNMCSLKKTIPCAGDLGKNLFFCSRQQGVVNYHTDMGNAGGKEVVELMQKIKQEVYESLSINWLDKSDPAICYRELYLQSDINRCLSPHLKKVETELNMILDKAHEVKDLMELKSLSTLVLNLIQLGVHFIHPVVTWDLLLTCVQRCGTADLPALVPLSAVCQQLFITEKAAWRGDVISEVVERFKDVLRENEKGFEHHDLVSVLQIAEKLSHFMSDNMFRDVASRINSEVEKHDLGFLNQNAAEIIKHVILFMSAPRKFGLYSPNRSINTDEYFPLQEIVFSTLQANKDDVVSVLGHHITRQGLMVIGNLNHRAVSLGRSVFNSCVQSISGFHGSEPLSNSKYKTDLIPQVDVDVNMEKGSSHLLGPDFGRLLCAVSTGLFKDTDWWILQEELFQSLRQGSVFSLIEVAEMLLSDHSILWSVKKASQKEFTMCFLHCWNDLNGHPRELRMILECIAVLAHPFYGIRDNELVSLLTRHLQSRCYMLPVRQLIHITSIIISYSSKASPPFLARPLLERLKSGDVHKMVSLLPRYVLKAFRDLEEFRVIGKLLDEMYYSLSLNDITKPDKDNLKWSRRKGIVTRWPKAVDRACLKQKYPTDAFYLITSLEFLEALEPRMLSEYFEIFPILFLHMRSEHLGTLNFHKGD